MPDTGLLLALDSFDLTDPAVPAGTAAFPGVSVQIAFGSDPDAVDSWTDVTADVHFATGVTVARGRNHELDDFTPGQIRYTLRDLDRTYDPLNSASTYNGRLTPGRRTRVRVSYGGTDYTLAVGFIEEWPQVYDRADHVTFVPIVAYDELARIARNTDIANSQIRPLYPWTLDAGERSRLDYGNQIGGLPTFTAENSGTRVTELLTAAGVPASRQAVDTGDSAVMSDQAVTGGAMEYLRRIVRTEYGRLFVDKTGLVTFWARRKASRTTSQRTSQATFTDAAGSSYPYHDLTIEPANARSLRNRVRRGRRGGAEFVKTSYGSITTHGLSEDTFTDGLFEPVSEANDQAQYVLTLYEDAVFRARQVVLKPRRAAATLFPVVCGVEIGDRYTITRTPLDTGAAFSQECWVEQITHAFTEKDWTTTLGLSLADSATYFIPDHAGAQDTLDAGYVLAY